MRQSISQFAAVLSLLLLLLATCCSSQIGSAELTANRTTTNDINESDSDEPPPLPAGTQPEQPEAQVLVDFVPPKVIDFRTYKSVFNKHYNSVTEELVKGNIYMTRSFQAFVSSVRYKYRKDTIFLGVNQMSDWPNAEIDQVYTGTHLPKEIHPTDKKNNVTKGLNADVKDKLVKLIKRHQLKPTEVSAGQQRNSRIRTKRDTETAALGRPILPAELAAIDQNLPPNLFERILNFFKSFQTADSPKKYTNVTELRDWRVSGCFVPTKDQGKCGSCFIFAIMGLFEWMLCRDTEKLVSLSEQYVVDCGERVGIEGCRGGFAEAAFTFVRRFGFELEAEYPYEKKAFECPYDDSLPGDEMGVLRLDRNYHGMHHIWPKDFDTYLDTSPIVVGIYIRADFTFYRGGVDMGIDCRKSRYGHSLLLIGDGIEDGIEYWLFRNSFGRFWGQMGHFKLSKSADCWTDFMPFGLVSNGTFEELGHHMQNFHHTLSR